MDGGRRIYRAVSFPLIAGCCWLTSYVWAYSIWIAGWETALVAQSARGDFQILIKVNTQGWADESGGLIDLRYLGLTATRLEGGTNNYAGRQWNWRGFGYGVGVVDTLQDHVGHSVGGVPYWFITLLASLPAMCLAMRAIQPWQRLSASIPRWRTYLTTPVGTGGRI